MKTSQPLWSSRLTFHSDSEAPDALTYTGNGETHSEHARQHGSPPGQTGQHQTPTSHPWWPGCTVGRVVMHRAATLYTWVQWNTWQDREAQAGSSLSSALPIYSSTSMVKLFASLSVISYIVTLFHSPPHLYFLLFQPRRHRTQSLFFSSYFLTHSREKKASIETRKSYNSEPSRLYATVGRILLSIHFHTQCQKPHKASASSTQAYQNHSPRTRWEDAGEQA